MGELLIGTEAIAGGVVTRRELQRWYRPIFRNVHAPKNLELSLRDRTVGAWLWTHRGGIVTGVAASALHGAEWVDVDVGIELIWALAKRYRGARGAPEAQGGAAADRRRCGLPAGDLAAAPVHRCGAASADHQDHGRRRMGQLVRTVDLGWEEFKVASEYDGGQHALKARGWDGTLRETSFRQRKSK